RAVVIAGRCRPALTGSPAGEAGTADKGRGQARRSPFASGEGGSRPCVASDACRIGGRTLEYPARGGPRRDCRPASPPEGCQPTRRKRQAVADHAAFEGQGPPLPRSLAQLHITGSTERLRRPPQKADRVLGGSADAGKGRQPVNAGKCPWCWHSDTLTRFK